MGFPTEMFESNNPLLDKLVCSICTDVLKEPQLLPCNHRFCNGCILKSLEKDQRCPMCRNPTKILDIRDDVTARDIIREFPVKCDCVSVGCQWTGPLGNLADHKKKCRFTEIDCLFAPHGCTVKMRKEDVEKHNATFQDKHLQMLCTSFTKVADENKSLFGIINRLEKENKNLEDELKRANKLIDCAINFERDYKQYFITFNNVSNLIQTKVIGQSVASTPFKAFGREWYLGLYPNGEKNTHFSLYLCLSKDPDLNNPLPNIKVMFSFTFVNFFDNKKSVTVGPTKNEFSSGSLWGWTTAFSHEVYRSDSGFSGDDTLTIRVKIERQ